MIYSESVKAKVCNKCRVYLPMHDTYDSKKAEAAFDRDHAAHPRRICLLSELYEETGYVSAQEKYIQKI